MPFNMSEELSNIFSFILSYAENYFFSKQKPTDNQDTPDTLELFLNKADFNPNASFKDIEHLISLIVKALLGMDPGEKQQFLVDYTRRQNIIDGQESKDYTDFLSSIMYLKDRQNVANLKAALSNLSQGVGNSPFNALKLQLGEKYSLLPIHKAVSAIFAKSGNVFSLKYKIPLQVYFSNNMELRDLKNPEPDVMLESTVTIDLNKTIEDPDQVTHAVTIQKLAKDLTWHLPAFNVFRGKALDKPEVLCTIEQLPDEDWLDVRRHSDYQLKNKL